MTPSEAAQYLPILKAYSEGRAIQLLDMDGKWREGACLFSLDPSRYRIRPEPRVVPWTFETCPVGAVVVHKQSGQRRLIIGSLSDRAAVGHEFPDYVQLLNFWTLLDGSPCGTVCNE